MERIKSARLRGWPEDVELKSSAHGTVLVRADQYWAPTREKRFVIHKLPAQPKTVSARTGSWVGMANLRLVMCLEPTGFDKQRAKTGQ